VSNVDALANRHIASIARFWIDQALVSGHKKLIAVFLFIKVFDHIRFVSICCFTWTHWHCNTAAPRQP